MKKYFPVFAMVSLCTVACSIYEIPVEQDSDFLIDIQVSEVTSTETKAIKRGWSVGEKISIWYDDQVQEEPSLELEYDGTEWVKTRGVKPPSSVGTMKALCYADNGMVLNSCQIGYQYETGVLAGKIEKWAFMTKLQITVSSNSGEMRNAAETYTLSCTHLYAPQAVIMQRDTIEMKEIKGGAVRGIASSDGIAFVFADCDAFDTAETEYRFELIIRNPENDSISENALIVHNIANPENGYYAAKIERSKFAEVNTETAHRGRRWGHDWVRLWDRGPKFATENISSGYYTRTEAIKACAEWGKGWRLLQSVDVMSGGYAMPKCRAKNYDSGITYTGKNEYAADTIYLPKSGQLNAAGDGILYPTTGRYWVSNTRENNTIFRYANIASSLSIDDLKSDEHRLSVRAVLE